MSQRRPLFAPGELSQTECPLSGASDGAAGFGRYASRTGGAEPRTGNLERERQAGVLSGRGAQIDGYASTRLSQNVRPNIPDIVQLDIGPTCRCGMLT